MDDRRRTISSEESMIGEGLMRVNNTLTAQRLTKSLSFQGNVRKRSTTRLVLSIISLVLMIALFVVGALIIKVIMLYEDPILGSVLPFLESMINGINTIFYATTEKAMYGPYSTQLTIETLNEVFKLKDKLGALDLGLVMDGLSGILGSLGGVVSDVGNEAGNVLGQVGAQVGGLANSIGSTSGSDLLGSLGVDQAQIADMTRNSLEATDATIKGVRSALENGIATIGNVSDALSGLAGK